MKIGVIGLGRMGSGIVKRLTNAKNQVVVWGRNEKVVAEAKKFGATGATSIDEFFKSLPSPRIIWLMIPANAVEELLGKISRNLSRGDIVVDGGNSNFKSSMRRAEELKKKGIFYMDVGTSGGLEGAGMGYCMMVGGDKEAFKKIEPLLKVLATKNGYGYIGESGAGHFVKMVHNGIEYGMMQSIAEGLDLIEHSKFEVNLKDLVNVWRNGSIIRGFLLDMSHKALEQHPDLRDIEGVAEESGEGRWTVETAIENKVPVPVIAHALFARFASQKKERFAMKVIAALREQFGGHSIKKKVK